LPVPAFDSTPHFSPAFCRGRGIPGGGGPCLRIATRLPSGFPLLLALGCRPALARGGLSLEPRNVLPGHKSRDITTHYCGPEPEELLQAFNRACGSESRESPARVLLCKRATSAAREKTLSLNK